MADLEALQKDYVRLIIEKGVCLQPGQTLVINCPVDQAWFARLCAAAAYDAGCREVVMNWGDDALSRMKLLRAADGVFDEFPRWNADMRGSLADAGAAFLSIDCDDPEALQGVDPDRLRRSHIAAGKALEHFRSMLTNNRCVWCVAAVPCPAWARKVFPDLDTASAMERLWMEILRAARADRGSAVADWSAHSAELREHIRILNDYAFQSLRYRSGLGTDLTVELPEGHFWGGAEETCTRSGVVFTPNIPTEEVFTAPRRDGVNGTVVSSKPLSLQGNLIEDFRFTIRDGKIVEVHAKKGEEVLRSAITLDEGASYLGEAALVPWDSPISRSGVLFYNTLFDENASCHFAFGDAYPCIEGGDQMRAEELRARGLNHSMTHVDFMIGTPDLSIVGTTKDGTEVPVFVDGRFAF